MTEKKDQQRIPVQQIKVLSSSLPKKSVSVDEPIAKQQPLQIKQQSLNANAKDKKVDLTNRKIVGKRLALVFYEVAKTNNSLFTQQQKYPLMVSLGGLFLTLCTATLINFGGFLLKPDEKKKKLFAYFGLANLFGSLFLGGYSLYRISDMYVKVPEQKWDIIMNEKQSYDKLSFSEKKAYLLKGIEEQQKQLKQAFIQSQMLKKQQRIDLTK